MKLSKYLEFKSAHLAEFHLAILIFDKIMQF